jgi:hypothetical protein
VPAKHDPFQPSNPEIINEYIHLAPGSIPVDIVETMLPGPIGFNKLNSYTLWLDKRCFAVRSIYY